jgi:glycolate oxidase FAD binding subunit
MTSAVSSSDTATIAARVRDHFQRREPLRVVGAGTWLDAGRPVRATSTLSLADDREIVEYEPGDLTITVRAGARLADIARATTAAGQLLTLDPWGGDDGTIGATIATATAGPRACAFGVPRDAVLGMEFVSGTGAVVRAGGRVVKNVAGFDLARLVTGAWGTLGVVTELTLRLRALPDRRETVAIEIRDAAVADVSRQLRHLPFVPIAGQLVNRALAQRVGLRDRTMLLVEIGGNQRALDAQRDALRALGSMEIASTEAWSALRTCDRGASGVVRFSQRPAEFAETWMSVLDAAPDNDTLVHGDPWRGVVRVVGSSDGSLATKAIDGTRIVERLPERQWERVPAPTSLPLARAVRQKFDPAGILNPGIMGDA